MCIRDRTYSAKGQIENGVAVGFPKEELLSYGVTENDLILTEAPSAEELAKLDPFYMSYFLPWNSYKDVYKRQAGDFSFARKYTTSGAPNRSPMGMSA